MATPEFSESGYSRPDLRLIPEPTAESRAFWTGGANGSLMVSRCQDCAHFFHPPGPSCWRCRSTNVAPAPVSGRGRVASFTINRQPWIPGFDPPYVIATVELEEEPDVRLITNVVGIAPEDMTVGLTVEAFFEEWGERTGESDTRVWVPLFRPADGGART